MESQQSSPMQQLFLNRYKMGRNIGQGSQGQVKLALDTLNSNRVAIKLFKHRKMDALDFVYLQREVNILKQLKGHKAFVNIIDFAEHVSYINGHGQSEIVSAIVMEYANNGCFFDLVTFFREKYDENIIRLVAIQLIDALEHMQQFKISHRDIKLENIVLDSNYNLKVIDFGLAVYELRDGKPKSNVGTSPFAPPERFLGKEYCGCKFDVFSLGVLLFFLKFNYYPFINNNPENSEEIGSFFIFSQNRQQFWEQILQTEKVEDLCFIDLIDQMLHQDPNHRPSIQQLRAHPFLQRNTNPNHNIQSYLSMRKEIMNEMLKKKRREKQEGSQQKQEQVFVSLQIKKEIQKETLVNTCNNDKKILCQDDLPQNLQISSVVRKNQQIVSSTQQPQENYCQLNSEVQQEDLYHNQQKLYQRNQSSDNQEISAIEISEHQYACVDQQISAKYELTELQAIPQQFKNERPLCKKKSSIINAQKLIEKYNLTQYLFPIRELMPKQQLCLLLTQQKKLKNYLHNSDQVFFLAINAKKQAELTVNSAISDQKEIQLMVTDRHHKKQAIKHYKQV